MGEYEDEEVEDYFDDNPSAEDYKVMFDEWLEEYVQVEYLENSDENWKKIQAMDPHLVWTDHGTCEDPKVTNGGNMFSGSCCWDTYGWYVMKNPWKGEPDTTYLSVNTGAYLPCHVCNRTGDEEDENECETCEGERWINHWFD